MEQKSWRKNRVGGGSLEEESWRRDHGGGHPGMEVHRRHPRGTRRQPGSTQEIPRRHPGGSQTHKAPEAYETEKLSEK